jgi:hypothetical protein
LLADVFDKTDDLVWGPGKSEMMFFSRKHENPQVSVRLGQTALRNVTEFKYLGIFFDRKLTWRLHAEFIQQRCHARVNFMKSIADQSQPVYCMVLYKSTVRSVIEYGGVCFSGMSDCYMRRLERIQWRAGRICFGLMRSTHVLSAEVLAGLPLIRQRLSFLKEMFLVSAFFKPNDLLMVKLDELHRTWNNSNFLPECQIVCECRMVSRTYFLTEFDLLLVDLTFVPRVHNCVRMGLRDVDESLFPIIAPRLLGEVLGELQVPTAIYTDVSKPEGLV